MRQRDNESLPEYHSRVEAMLIKLADLGKEYSEEDAVEHLLSTLSERYAGINDTILLVDPENRWSAGRPQYGEGSSVQQAEGWHDSKGDSYMFQMWNEGSYCQGLQGAVNEESLSSSEELADLEYFQSYIAKSQAKKCEKEEAEEMEYFEA